MMARFPLHCIQILCFVLAVTSTFIYGAPLRQEFRLNADVQKSFSSGSVEIEAAQTAFVSIYNSQLQTFPDLMILFKVKSLQSELRDSYTVLLRALAFECDYQPLNMTADIDGVTMTVGDVSSIQSYSDSDLTHKWHQHQMNIHFPIILENVYQQSCNGYIGIEVSLVL